MREIIGLYGKSGCGKTTCLAQTIPYLSSLGIRCSGVISPAQFAENHKTGIYSRLIPSGEQKLLASLAKPGDSDTLGKWKMFPETIVWVKNDLFKKTPCDLWIIDEIGPYELEQKKGLFDVLDLVSEYPSKVVILTYRPRFEEVLKTFFPRMRSFNLEDMGQKIQVKDTLKSLFGIID